MYGPRSLKEDSRNPLGRGVWVAYLSVGTALAVLRLSVLAWVEHRTATGQMTDIVYSLVWCLRPELLIGEYTSVGAVHFESLVQHFFFWGSILTLGSFILATPILLVGWLRQQRR
jgi:hypothetical protein